MARFYGCTSYSPIALVCFPDKTHDISLDDFASRRLENAPPVQYGLTGEARMLPKPGVLAVVVSAACVFSSGALAVIQATEPGAVNVQGFVLNDGPEGIVDGGYIGEIPVMRDTSPSDPAPTGGMVHNHGDAGHSKNADQGDPCGKKPGDSGNTAGNPVNFSTGNKIEPETDFESKGEMALALKRTYNSYWDGVGVFGRYWLSSFDYKLLIGDDRVTSSCYPMPGTNASCDPTNQTLWAQRVDGRKIKFNYVGGTPATWQEDKASPIAFITRNADGSFTLHSEDHTVETYDAGGFPVKILDEQGVGWTFTYNANHYLARVTHNSGRAVTLTWNGNQLASVADPAGHVFSYTYSANKFGTGQHLLIQTIQPGVADPVNSGGTPPVTWTYQYENPAFTGALTGVTINGTRFSWFSYDTSGRATSTWHLNNADKYSFSYGSPAADGSHTVTVTNPLGKQTVYTYDGQGNQVSVEGKASANCPANYKQSTYDANGNPALVSDFRNGLTSYTYNAKGQVTQIVENAGNDSSAPQRTTQITWDDKNHQIRKTVLGLYQVDTAYTSDGRIASVTTTNLSATGHHGETHTVSYSYTVGSNGLPTKIVQTGPSPNAVVTYNYDSLGDLVSIVNALGQAIAYGNFNGLGEAGSVTDPNGNVTTLTYDPMGRLARSSVTINGTARAMVFAYNAKGQVTDTWLRDGRHIVNTYDGAYRLTQTSEVVSISPDPDVPSEQDSTTRQTLYTYDANGDILSKVTQNVYVSWYIQQPCNNPLSLQAKAAGAAAGGGAATPQMAPGCTPLRSTSTSIASRQYTDYDELGRPIAQRGNNGQSIRFTYDANGNLTSASDALGHVTRYGYDVFDRVNHITDAANGNTWVGHDLGNRVRSVLDPRGLTTQYGYDGFGQLWWITSPDTGESDYHFDAYGRMASSNRNDGIVVSYTYDALDRITSKSSSTQSQTFTYDTCGNGKGRLCGVADANGSESFGYDLQGNLISQRIVTHNRDYTTSYGYDVNGQLSSITYPSGTAVQYTRTGGDVTLVKATVNGTATNVVYGVIPNAEGQATLWSYGNGVLRQQSFDTDGRLTALKTTAGSTALQDYGYVYDAANRLAQRADHIETDASATYGYDALGRLTSESTQQAGSAVGYGYDANGNRISTTWIGTTPLVIDANSNHLLQDGGRQFTYDANGSRKTWIVNGTTATYSYDGFGRLASVMRDQPYSDFTNTYPAGTTTYNVNPLGQRVYKQGPAGEFWFDYGPDSQLMADYITGQGWTDYLYFQGQPVALVRGGSIYYIHGDHLGRPETVTNSGKAILWQAANGTFGRNAVTGTLAQVNLGFPGQYYDAETGHWYNVNRDYDQLEGRYLESDPTGLLGGTNTYIYVDNNPISNIDYLGFICVPKWAAGVGGAAVGGLVLGGLTGAAEGKSLPTAFLGALVGSITAAAAEGLSYVFGKGENGDSAAAAGAQTLDSLIESRGNVEIAMVNAGASALSTKLGYRGPGTEITARMGAYIVAGTYANSGLGPGRYVAGPIFGIAAGLSDSAAQAAINHAGNPCDCKK